MFVFLLIVVLIVVAVLFGGFQKGTKSGSLDPAFPSFTTAQTTD
jgi:hypothetical protein